MGQGRRVLKVLHGQVCRDDQGLPRPGPGVDHVVDLFDGKRRVPLDPQVVDHQKGILLKAVDPLLAFVVEGPLKRVQDSREVGDADADQAAQKGVRDTTGQEGLPGPDVAIEQDSDVVRLHVVPVLDVFQTDVADFRVPAVVLAEGVFQIGRVRDPVAAKALHAGLKVLFPPGLFLGFIPFLFTAAISPDPHDAGRANVGRDVDVHFLSIPTGPTAQEAFGVGIVALIPDWRRHFL